MRKLLMVVFYYPPCKSAAVQRLLKFSEYLPDFGWEPIVLTANARAYPALDYSQEIPDFVQKHLYRTAALDVQRHLSYKGKYFSWMKIPDRWNTWMPTAIHKGKQLIKEYKPDAIFSSYPNPGDHYIAYKLSKSSGLPWIAEYRDPMRYHYAPQSGLLRRVNESIDKKTIEQCSRAVFATNNMRRLYQKVYSGQPSDKFITIENGFDEKVFSSLGKQTQFQNELFSIGKFSILYTGALYKDGRDPLPIFEAIAELQQEGQISARNFELIFQGSGDGRLYQSMIESLNISSLIRFTPSVPFIQSLQSITLADALLVIQDSLFNLQVPGKLYEYSRSEIPIIVHTPRNSATYDMAEKIPGCHLTSSVKQIKDAILTILKINAPIIREYQQFTRYQRTKELSLVLNSLVT